MASTGVLPPTEGRVPIHAYESHNRKITDDTIANLERYARAAPSEVTRRLGELAKEFDMERTLELNSSIAASVGLLLGLAVSRYWLALSFVVLGFLMQHSLQGYCPPAVWFRAYGWRTAGEIEDEAAALRVVHGRALGSLRVNPDDRARLVAEMVDNKRRAGRFIGEGPNVAVEKAAGREGESAGETKEE